MGANQEDEQKLTTSILPPENSTPWELAVEQTSGERWEALDIDVINRARDPWTCPEHLLPQLAYQRSVDIWDESWPVEKKRQVIADAPEDHPLKTTEEGIARYVRHAGGTVERVITVPQGLFAVEGWTDAERAAFLAQLDQVRIHRFYPVDVKEDGLFAGDSFFDEDFYNSEPSWHGYRKHAVLHRAGGEVVDLDITWQQQIDAAGVSTEIETIILPGEPDAGLYAGADFFDLDFLDVERVGDRLIQISTPGAYGYSYGRLQFGIVFPRGLDVGVEPELIFETAPNKNCGTFAGDDFYDDGFWMPDDSWQQVYERYYLNNPAANIDPIQTGGCYFDDAWYGWEDFTALITVELVGKQAEFGADEFWDVGFFLPPETEAFWKLADAIQASKALSDKTLLTTTTHRWPRLGDRLPLDGSWSLGEMIKDR